MDWIRERTRGAARIPRQYNAMIAAQEHTPNVLSAKMKTVPPPARLTKNFPKSPLRLLISAERLYGQHGLDGVSLRQIGIAASHGNKYAVQHYFGSKLGLIQAVSEMRLPVLETERRRLMSVVHGDRDYSGHRLLGTLLF